eukprot:TRINITY_DN1531_c0_g1_i9.p1 TRINITY_DN1531_c0_g1~~TRINITY_DN1531_c0_g1_i9.p1  ORF type:complete len:109 (+),score=41.31 TRINITY_DN1531_c0_g1_i9:55-381(+)
MVIGAAVGGVVAVIAIVAVVVYMRRKRRHQGDATHMISPKNTSSPPTLDLSVIPATSNTVSADIAAPPPSYNATPAPAPLPAGWTEYFTDQGTPYYVDVNGNSQWHRP